MSHHSDGFRLREVLFPDMYRTETGLRGAVRLRRSIERADCIVTATHATEADLHAQFRLNGKPMHVIPGAVDPYFKPQDPQKVNATLSRLAVSKPTWSTMGSADPRKNIPNAIRAFLRTCGDPATTSAW